MLNAACPHCTQGVGIEDHHAGKIVVCPACKGQFIAPPLALIQPKHRGLTRTSRIIIALLVFATAAAGVLLSVCVGGYFFRSRSFPIVAHVPYAPDVAIYNGVYFSSRDGMKTYKDIDLVPRFLTGDVALVLPDDETINVQDISPDLLRAHDLKFNIIHDDGRGNYTIMCEDDVQIAVLSHRPICVSLSSPTFDPNLFSVQLKGKQVTVPIKRADLEALLGPPDEIQLDTFPETRDLSQIE